MAAVVFTNSQQAASSESGRLLLTLKLHGASVEGTALAWSARQALLLDREGRLLNIDPSQARNVQTTTSPFRCYSPGALRNRLSGEFGKAYDISSTGHYLVVHPRGRGSEWSQRFEDLYRSFVHYFKVRGFTVRDPEFPLVAVVLPTRTEFLRYAAREGTQIDSGVLGYYSPMSNRVALYDLEADRDRADWSRNADTIIHEATHQTAFNTGIHNRFMQSPRWVVEGLGTLFEAPGVWNSRQYTRLQDRLNEGRLADFHHFTAQIGKPGYLAEMVSSDRHFNTQPAEAYAAAWAWTHYLVEKLPRQYAKLLALTARRPDFQAYTSNQRLADFSAAFGANLRLLQSQFSKYMETVR